MKLEINEDVILKGCKEELEKRLKTSASEMIRNLLDLLFAKPEDQQRLLTLSPAVFNYRYGKENKPDIGLIYKKITGIITEHAMGERMETFARNYIEKHFEAKLIEACDLAMTHKTKAIAFKQVNQKGE